MFFDTHCHYDDSQYDEDREQIISLIRSEGVKHFVNVSSDLPSVDHTLSLLERYPEAYGALGIHPSEVGEITFEDIEEIGKKALSDPRIVAIGEIGLDYHYDDGSPGEELQKHWFREQLKLASRIRKPVIIHSRDAVQDTFDILSEENASENGGVIHCFSASAEMAELYVKFGFFIGIGGVVTFKNARKLVEVVERTPLENIVLETDCPYLAPAPFRGKRNHSGFLHLVAEKIAEIKDIPYPEVCRVTYDNALKLYRLA